MFVLGVFFGFLFEAIAYCKHPGRGEVIMENHFVVVKCQIWRSPLSWKSRFPGGRQADWEAVTQAWRQSLTGRLEEDKQAALYCSPGITEKLSAWVIEGLNLPK